MGVDLQRNLMPYLFVGSLQTLRYESLEMVKVRRVYVVTSNSERVPEFQRLLQLYGIEVCHASPFGYRTKRDGPKALLPLAQQLLQQNNEHFWTKSVMFLGEQKRR